MNRRQFIFAGSAALLAACGKVPGKIRLALNWKPDPQFGGFTLTPTNRNHYTGCRETLYGFAPSLT